MQVPAPASTRTSDAWALHAGGRDAEALKAAAEALAVGIRDASMLYHAGVIAAATGDRATAERYLGESLAVSPVSEVAADARAALSKLRP